VDNLSSLKKAYPEKFVSEDEIFSHIRRGDHIFVSSGCGEPQYLVQALTKYLEAHPKAFFDAEIIHIYSLGLAPYTEAKYKANFRHNSFLSAIVPENPLMQEWQITHPSHSPRFLLFCIPGLFASM